MKGRESQVKQDVLEVLAITETLLHMKKDIFKALSAGLLKRNTRNK